MSKKTGFIAKLGQKVLPTFMKTPNAKKKEIFLTHEGGDEACKIFTIRTSGGCNGLSRTRKRFKKEAWRFIRTKRPAWATLYQVGETPRSRFKHKPSHDGHAGEKGKTPSEEQRRTGHFQRPWWEVDVDQWQRTISWSLKCTSKEFLPNWQNELNHGDLQWLRSQIF